MALNLSLRNWFFTKKGRNKRKPAEARRDTGELVISDPLITNIGAITCRDADADLPNWESLALVYSLSDGQTSDTGFIYQGAQTIPFCGGGANQGPFPLRDKVKELRSQIKAANGRAFCQLLIQIENRSGRIRIDFEFDDPTRWSIGPKNLIDMRRCLKPAF